MCADINSLLAFPRNDISSNGLKLERVNRNENQYNSLLSTCFTSGMGQQSDILFNQQPMQQLAPFVSHNSNQNPPKLPINPNPTFKQNERMQPKMPDPPPHASHSSHTTTKGKKKKDRENEIARVQQRVSGFDFLCSDAWSYLCRHFGNKVTQEELVSIADAIKPYARVKLDRDARRRKSVILKWYQDNWPQIQHYIKYVVLEDESTSSP